jgi:spore coat polysaccharide biosynthesis protein SpsF
MQTAFLITARLKSKRLPKKILLEVQGKPLVVHMINRIKYAKKINKIIICTSTNEQDDPLEEIAKQEKIDFYRGSEDDVLQRLLDTAKKFNLNYFANITADIPMIDPFLIDQSLGEYEKKTPDILVPEAYSFGACMVIKVSSLEKVCKIKKETNTEVWLKFFKSQKDFYIHSFKVANENKHKFLKTSLDYPEDYTFIKRIFDELHKLEYIFRNKDIIDLIKKDPNILKINSDKQHLQRWYNHIAKLSN